MNDPRIHILLIEDNPGDADLLRAMLAEARSITVDLIWTDRLTKGLDLLPTGKFDVALVNLSLPDASGLDTVVRTRQAAPDIPIIVLTGSVDAERGLTAVREGAQDYLIKGGVNTELIVRTIRYAIERKRTERELAQYARELRFKNEEMQADLGLAREIQLACLPQQYPTFPHGVPPSQSAFRFHHHYQTATQLAGDFFSILELNDTTAGIFLCDVMGHGVRAALVTAMLRALVEELRGVATEPSNFLAQMNAGLQAILKQAGTTIYATAFYAVAKAGNSKIRWANAGHPGPLHVQRACDAVEILPVHGHSGPALGLFADPIFPTQEFPVARGDMLLMYTDGVFEILGAQGEDFGQERLMKVVGEHLQEPSEQLFASLLQSVKAFAAKPEFPDDICLVALEVR